MAKIASPVRLNGRPVRLPIFRLGGGMTKQLTVTRRSLHPLRSMKEGIAHSGKAWRLQPIECPSCGSILNDLQSKLVPRPAKDYESCRRRCDRCGVGFSNSAREPTRIYRLSC